MKPTFQLLAAVCLALTFTGCGAPPESDTSAPEYIRFGSSYWGLARRVHQSSIVVCIKGADTEANRKMTALALRSWLSTLRHLDSTVTNGVSFSCTSPSLKIDWKTVEGRASTTLHYDTPLMTLWSNSPFRTVHHELGHAFGLGDTYDEAALHMEPTEAEIEAGLGEGDRPDSVMKLGRYGKAVLYPDDIEGVQSIGMALGGAAGSTYGPEVTCTTSSGQPGRKRLITKGGSSRYSTCRSVVPYHQYDYEPTLTPCSGGRRTYGLYDSGRRDWIPEFQSVYSC